MKQVIVIRKDLKVRKGKMIAQGAHASLMAYLNALSDRDNFIKTYEWLQKHNQTKIVVGVETEADLQAVYRRAQENGVSCSLVLDAGKTEFAEPTYTACAVGPAENDIVDLITGHLKLL
jgi:PTH2 family peptidyl-tRNA hydrolase